jgi:hypothetical protein
VVLVVVPAEPGDEDLPGPAPRFEILALEAASGDEVISFGHHASSCVGDGHSQLVCRRLHWPSQRLATLQVDNHEAGLSDEVPSIPLLLGVHEEYVFAGDHDESLILDRAGNLLEDDPPGYLLAISDQYAIFTNELGRGRFTIQPLND